MCEIIKRLSFKDRLQISLCCKKLYRLGKWYCRKRLRWTKVFPTMLLQLGHLPVESIHTADFWLPPSHAELKHLSRLNELYIDHVGTILMSYMAGLETFNLKQLVISTSALDTTIDFAEFVLVCKRLNAKVKVCGPRADTDDWNLSDLCLLRGVEVLLFEASSVCLTFQACDKDGGIRCEKDICRCKFDSREKAFLALMKELEPSEVHLSDFSCCNLEFKEGDLDELKQLNIVSLSTNFFQVNLEDDDYFFPWVEIAKFSKLDRVYFEPGALVNIERLSDLIVRWISVDDTLEPDILFISGEKTDIITYLREHAYVSEFAEPYYEIDSTICVYRRTVTVSEECEEWSIMLM